MKILENTYMKLTESIWLMEEPFCGDSIKGEARKKKVMMMTTMTMK